jgi:ABC-type enterochelin transport system permease subunit
MVYAMIGPHWFFDILVVGAADTMRRSIAWQVEILLISSTLLAYLLIVGFWKSSSPWS